MTRDELHEALTAAGWRFYGDDDLPDEWRHGEEDRVYGYIKPMRDGLLVQAFAGLSEVAISNVPASKVLAAYAAASAAVAALPVLR